jgi:hypothetical protein
MKTIKIIILLILAIIIIALVLLGNIEFTAFTISLIIGYMLSERYSKHKDDKYHMCKPSSLIVVSGEPRKIMQIRLAHGDMTPEEYTDRMSRL